MDTTGILIPLIKLFLIIIPGYILSKKCIINEEQNKGISLIVVYVTWPCLIVDALQMPVSRDLLINACYVTAAMFTTLIIAYLLSRTVCRVASIEKSKTYLFTFMLIFANTGFMGIPISFALYGKEGVFYAVLIDALCNIAIYTMGIALIRKSIGMDGKGDYSQLLSPGMAGIVIGALLFLTNTRLPSALGESVALIGSATAPLAMLTLGFQLGKIRLKELLGDLRIYLLAFLKLAIMPLIFLLVLTLIFTDLSLFAKVIILEASMPVAASSAIFTQRYDGDVKFATKGVLLSTALSIITIPIFTLLMN
ncbi:MAG TPA: AEC family transporter [Anaerovoracaceae bacterium]|nr:AEC family transporter [Anaerovoracaceae bacterium]